MTTVEDYSPPRSLIQIETTSRNKIASTYAIDFSEAILSKFIGYAGYSIKHFEKKYEVRVSFKCTKKAKESKSTKGDIRDLVVIISKSAEYNNKIKSIINLTINNLMNYDEDDFESEFTLMSTKIDYLKNNYNEFITKKHIPIHTIEALQSSLSRLIFLFQDNASL